MTKLEEIAQVVQQEYKKDKPDSAFVNCVVDVSSAWDNMFFTTQRKDKTKKKFSIIDVVPTMHTKLPSFSTGIQLNGKELAYGERTGLFKIMFSDGTFMYAAKWFSGIGKNRTIESMFATEGKVWCNFLNLTKQAYRKKRKPKIGVYNIVYNQMMGGVIYEPFKKLPNNNIYHDELDIIKGSINYYFDNVKSFMKYNQAGRRTMLLYGEPGTSKTSTLYKLAAEHKDTKCVVFSTDINAIAAHVQSCEKYAMPTIACFEDCESALSNNSSDVKNFLSGIHAKQNKGGTCLVFTSNYPEKIEESIKERPERIDELHYIGPITGKMLVACAKFYFGTFAPSDEMLTNVLDKQMTGAEVKLFVDNALKYCASQEKELNEESMIAVLKNYRDDIKKLQKFSEGKMKKTFTKSSTGNDSFGFSGITG